MAIGVSPLRLFFDNFNPGKSRNTRYRCAVARPLLASIYAPRGFAKFNTPNLAKPRPFCSLSINASHYSNKAYGIAVMANPPRFCHEKNVFIPLAKPK